LDLISLAGNIHLAVINIDSGRKAWATKGKEAEGRIAFEEGINLAMSTFKRAQASADPQILIFAEYTFICQELQLCRETNDKGSLSSLVLAKQNFDDAFLALKIIEDKTLYQAAEKTYSHYKDYRVSSFPKDAFHVACGSHKARFQNALKVFGIDPIEKTLLKQRADNILTAKNAYIAKQKKVLECT